MVNEFPDKVSVTRKEGYAPIYTLPKKLISVHKPRVVSEEQRLKIGNRLKESRKLKNKKSNDGDD